MRKRFNSLEIFEDYEGWAYRFHGDGSMYTQSGFDSPRMALEAVRENDWVTQTTRPIRIVATSKVVQKLGLDLIDVTRSPTPGSDLMAVSFEGGYK